MTHPVLPRRGFAARIRAALPLAAVVMMAGATAAHATETDPPARFTRPFFAGAYLGQTESRTENVGGALQRFERLVGKRPALVKTFHRMDVDFSAQGWAGQLLRRVDAAGSTNFVALDLKWSGAPQRGLLDAIVAGRADAHIVRAARGMAAMRTPVLVEPGWEMNGDWAYAWQGVANGDTQAPRKFQQAFRRIVDIFRREGATNVKWVFGPNVGNAVTDANTGPAHWNWYGHYYPGDRYVDYLGPHGYNGPSVWGGGYKPFAELFDGRDADRLLSDLERRYPTKPIIIGEYAAQEGGGDKGAWITDAFDVMRRHPNVVGAIWFNTRKEADWRIDSSRTALAAYRAAVADPMVRTSFN
jgi:endoglucanase